MIITPLMKHQAEGLKYLKGHDPCALFWKMGTGKSMTALAYAEYVKAKRILITSDKNNIVNTWPDQIYSHTDYGVEVRPKALTRASGDHDVFCTCVNYDLLKSHFRMYMKVPWDMWIGDESSEFKDQRTERHKRLDDVVRNIPHKVILNGEPMTERLEDLFGQFKILDGGRSLGRSIVRFRHQYMKLREDGYGWEPRRNSYTDIQRAVEDVSHWMMDPDIIMPTQLHKLVRVDLTPEQRKHDDELKEWFMSTMNEHTIDVKYAAALFIKRIQLANGIFRYGSGEGEAQSWTPVDNNKMPTLAKLVRQNPYAKIAVWHQYIPETEYIHTYLDHDGLPHMTYTGPNDPEPLDRFRRQDRGVLLIRNSMCKGLNQLADADIAVIYSDPLSYRSRVQLMARSQRMTSKNKITNVVHLITRGGADEVVYNMLSRKRDAALTLKALRDIVCHS